jgi:hypothetical protein
MAEGTLVDYVLDGMKPIWRAPVKHADPYSPGVADLSAFLPGAGNIWIECKALDGWPKRAETAVKMKRYTDEQRLFLFMRRGFLLLRVAREYLLFDDMNAWQVVGRVNQETLRLSAMRTWKGSIDWAEFATTIKGNRPNYRDKEQV